jgi:hypothetical protein
MPHKRGTKEEKHDVWQGSSIILLPANRAMLRVAKPLHFYAPPMRHVPLDFLKIGFGNHLHRAKSDA